MEEHRKMFKKFRIERIKNQCPVCDDLELGYLAACEEMQKEIDKLNEELDYYRIRDL